MPLQTADRYQLLSRLDHVASLSFYTSASGASSAGPIRPAGPPCSALALPAWRFSSSQRRSSWRVALRRSCSRHAKLGGCWRKRAASLALQPCHSCRRQIRDYLLKSQCRRQENSRRPKTPHELSTRIWGAALRYMQLARVVLGCQSHGLLQGRRSSSGDEDVS